MPDIMSECQAGSAKLTSIRRRITNVRDSVLIQLDPVSNRLDITLVRQSRPETKTPYVKQECQVDLDDTNELELSDLLGAVFRTGAIPAVADLFDALSDVLSEPQDAEEMSDGTDDDVSVVQVEPQVAVSPVPLPPLLSNHLKSIIRPTNSTPTVTSPPLLL